jgi:hypothetical protein
MNAMSELHAEVTCRSIDGMGRQASGEKPAAVGNPPILALNTTKIEQAAGGRALDVVGLLAQGWLLIAKSP